MGAQATGRAARGRESEGDSESESAPLGAGWVLVGTLLAAQQGPRADAAVEAPGRILAARDLLQSPFFDLKR
jgi:hypothetical protein